MFWQILACTINPENSESWQAIEYVDPMIGSVAKTKFYGRTFPGATLPFSLVKLSPDTYTGGDVGSGYSYEHETLEGFSFIHMSGIGWFGDFGNLLVTPINGIFHPNRGNVENPETGYRSRISHDTEIAKAGYYLIKLEDYNINAEMTVTQRTGILRFTFPNDNTNRIQIDLAGLAVPDYMQGKSMAGWYRNGKGPNHPYLYMGLHNNHNAWRAVWDGNYLLSMLDYKLFYDHAKDPYELDNLYENPAFNDKRKEYESILIGLAKETGDPILPRLEQALKN